MKLVISVLIILATLLGFLPLINNQRWYFRIWEFGRIQLFFILAALLLSSVLIFKAGSIELYIYGAICLIAMTYQAIVLFPYTTWYGRRALKEAPSGKQPVSMLSINVYQFNKDYNKLLGEIAKANPDIVLTMESNADWEQALIPLENSHPHCIKVSQENTYGMHLYSRISLTLRKVHRLVSDDIPSFEIDVQTADGDVIKIFCLHPPPPSPTEEPTSKERDGELMAAAKRIQKTNLPVVVVGDFNNVAWSRSSKLFRRNAQLIDPRIGYGFVSTFHAKYRLFRFPIDLFFHTPGIVMIEFRTLGQVGSDHLPLYAKFCVGDKAAPEQLDELEVPQEGDSEETEELIEEGIKTNGDRPANAKEG